jgi:hypothetical protein
MELEILFWRLFNAVRSAAVSLPLLAARMLRSYLHLRRERSTDVLETLGNARLLVSFTLPGSSRGRCGLSYGRNN